MRCNDMLRRQLISGPGSGLPRYGLEGREGGGRSERRSVIQLRAADGGKDMMLDVMSEWKTRASK